MYNGNVEFETPELIETSAIKDVNLGVMLVFWAFLSFITENEFTEPIENPGPDLSGLPRKRRANRLFYMLNTPEGFVTASKAQTAVLKKEMPDALYAVWAANAGEARQRLNQGEGENYKEQLQRNFSGHLLNCIGWQKVIDKNDKEITRCFIYAPNCKTKACIKDTEERKAEGWTPRTSPKTTLEQAIEKAQRTVKDKTLYIYETYEGSYRITSKAVDSNSVSNLHIVKPDHSVYKIERQGYSEPAKIVKLSGIYKSCKSFFRNAKGHLKCGEYALTCNQDTECASKPAPVPWKPQEREITEREIKSVAKMLSDEANHAIDDSKRIMRLVKYHGGIAPYKSGYLSEEYKDIPSKYKLKTGLPLDELAQEIGMNESDLVEAINKAEEARSKLPQGKRRFNVKDMLYDAEQYLVMQESAGGMMGIKSPVDTKSALTAIKRKSLSAPAAFLFANGLLKGNVLDFGAGRGFDADKLGIDKYDPNYFQEEPKGKYDTIMSNYVLNVLEPENVNLVIDEALEYLQPGGTAYFTVRRDIKKEGITSKGTKQFDVKLNYPIVYEKKNSYAIYKITKKPGGMMGSIGDYSYHYKNFDDPVDISYAKKLIQSALAKNVDKLEPSQIQSLFTKLRDEEQRLINYGFKGKSIQGDFLYTNLNYAINHLLKIYKPEAKRKTELEQLKFFGTKMKHLSYLGR